MKVIRYELADTPATLAKGLMDRYSLGADEGMLFKFPEPRFMQFWAKNTYIPLDLVFIEAGKVVEVRELAPLSTKIISSSVPCTMALELNRGTAKDAGIVPGDSIEIDESQRVIRLKGGSCLS